jgi:vacuolar-type H+-ATPase subunit H
MEQTIEKIKIAEAEAKKTIAEVRKNETARLNAARENAEARKIEIRKRGEKTVEDAVKASSEKAQAEIDRMKSSHDNDNTQLRKEVVTKMDNAVEQIVEAFIKWR